MTLTVSPCLECGLIFCYVMIIIDDEAFKCDPGGMIWCAILWWDMVCDIVVGYCVGLCGGILCEILRRDILWDIVLGYTP